MNQIKQGYKQTKVGIIPEDWEVVKLGKVTKINPNNKNLPENFIYIDLESVVKGKLLKQNFISKYEAPSRAQRVLKKNDILFQMVRPYQMNNLFFEFDGDYVASTGYAQIRTNQSDKYIFQYIHLKRFVDKVLEKCTGSNYPAINSSDLSDILIILPPLKEQEKIAEILTTWDKAITKQTELLRAKELQKKALMQKLLSGEVRFNGFNDVWQEIRLDKLVFFQEGPGVRNTQYRKSGVKLLNVGNLNNNILNLSSTETYISEEEAYGVYKHFLVDEGDLLISCSGINSESFKKKIAFVKKEHLPLCMNTSTMRFKNLKNKLLLEYLYFFFQTLFFEKQVFGVLTGSAQFNFGPTHIKWFKIKLPSLPEQQKIAEVLSLADDEINLLKTELEELNLQKKALMQKLLTGQVRVKV